MMKNPNYHKGYCQLVTFDMVLDLDTLRNENKTKKDEKYSFSNFYQNKTNN